MPETSPSRRLRFALDIAPDESIPGAIARGVRDHVLVCTRPVLDAGGVTMKHIGHAQLASPRDLERLAFVIRCPPGALAANAGHRVATDTPSRTVDVRFGTKTIPMSYLEMERRRISPLSLRKAPHHRLDWMNLLLPYCPESLEPMTASCPSCEARLGWHYAKGIGTCEHCEAEIAPSKLPHLSTHLKDDYVLFAKLASLRAHEAVDAVATLPLELRSAAPSTLVNLALQLGGIVQHTPVATTSRVEVARLSDELLASVAAAGTALLRSWPSGFRSWVADRSAQLQADPAALRDLRVRLQRLAARRRGTDDVADIVAHALPDLRKHAVHAFSEDRRYYLYKEVQKHLALDAAQMEALRNWPAIRYRRSTTSAHQRGQFDADQVDAAVAAFRGSVHTNSCTGRLRLPRYGVEQCCRPGLLELEDDPMFLAIKSPVFVRSTSLEALRAGLIGARSLSRQPASAVSLSVASKRIGGRRKPWGSIIQALLDARLRFWLAGAEPTAKSIMVTPASIAMFDSVVDDPRCHGIEPVSVVSQADAAEILNLKHDLLPDLSESLGLKFELRGHALLTSLPDLLEVASSVAWNTEVGWHLGVRHNEVERLLVARGIDRWRSTGWDRRQLIEEGVLPGLAPHSTSTGG